MIPLTRRLFLRLQTAMAALALAAPVLSEDLTRAEALKPITAATITIRTEPQSTGSENRVAQVLANRIAKRSAVAVALNASPSAAADLTILLGKPGGRGRIDQACMVHAVRLPGMPTPAPEGFALKTVRFKNGPGIVAVGADDRGVLYAAGELLRRLRYEPDHILVPQIDVSTAPAYRFRGCSANQGGTMRRVTGARAWTQEELFDVLLDYALAGGNTFYTGDSGGPAYDFVKSFGLMSVTGARPNQLFGEFPKKWSAGGRESWEGKTWVCPSIPEARAALLAQWEKDFAGRADHDVMRFFAGDPGGCDDDRCKPWGKTFVLLCEEMAAIWHKYHPNSLVLIANQDLSNEGDQAIFDYLNAAPRPWLYGLCYGPGSNAMSSYFRDELREDLFVYPRSGPINRYLAETLHQLPAAQTIVHYSDITHWISAQYKVEHPQRVMMKAYGRRTFHARPRAFYHIFQAIMPFSEGDIIYSEGYHDELHQYLWCRLLWNPNRTLDDVLLEYATYHFGEAAAPTMREAILELENVLETPVESNSGIGRYYDLVRQAGNRMPSHFMTDNYRWRAHMEKAALDRHLQLRLLAELDKERRVREMLAVGLESSGLKTAVENALCVLREPVDSPELAALREEARRLGEETDRLFGIRNVGYFKLDNPLRDLPALTGLLERARTATSTAERRRIVRHVIDATATELSVGNIFW